MGKLFSIDIDESIFNVLAQYILSKYSEKEISALKIILPHKRDVTALLGAFTIGKCMILPEITSLEHIDEEELMQNSDRVQVLTPENETLLLIEFILKWNKENNDNYPIDLAYSIAPLLNISEPIKHLEKIENFIELLINTWGSTLKNLGMVSRLEHTRYYINNIILSLRDTQHIIFVGIEKNEIHQSLIKAIYNLPYGIVILPNLNFKISEKNWQSLHKKHYQYIIKNLLDDMNISRDEITHLGKQSDKIIDYIFDTTSQLNVQKCVHNHIEIITCHSVEEEAESIASIIKNKGYDNVSLLIDNPLLAIRITCLLKQYDITNYSYITLLLYSIELLTSNWNSVALLSLLKHHLIEFRYTQEKYFEILTEFEIEILRNFNINGFKNIIDTINKHKKIKYQKDILIILNRLQTILDPLLHMVNRPIFEIVTTHLQCFSCLPCIGIITDFVNACKNTKIKCSLELYSKILNLFFQKHFVSTSTIENNFSLYKTKVMVFADLNCLQEEQNYFLYNLFCANKVYIVRLSNQRKSLLLKRIEIFYKEKTYNYKNIVTNIMPCTQPIPKPGVQVRMEKMQLISCSALEKLIRNPYTFYIEYILNIRKLKDLNAKLSKLEFSTIMHKIFEKHSFDISQEECLSNFSSMWWIRLQKIIQSFIKTSNTRSQHIETEKSFSLKISKEISLVIKCDRIEHLADNNLAIIDYKLGIPPSQSEVMPIQLILQALAVESSTKKKISELAYWKCDYDQAKIVPLIGYREKMQEFQDILPQFLSHYLSADTPFTASPYLDKFLRFNDYTHLERIKEWL
ncbi:hypothetical protein BIY23_03655 [Wolbachia pipientis]|uniref:PD-(D/E)XK endonuclease-like domain-containing protein n=1 Tax=Wolbachia pipientis TaxID=955 RepID=A0A1E7QJ55_WOLPI|nr:PD-(D/E)XK nuclease family protein [Wolbachia pipientis]OEY86495.1 hypothetical protein BIY23_03655 [Wolbachia pipientis]